MKTKNDSPHIPVKLHVQHHDHIDIVSAHLQDAIVSAASFSHDPNQRFFKMLSNRFCWEKFLNPDNPIKMRVHAGIHFNHVTKVQKKNIHLHHPEKLYNLMSMQASTTEVLLKFSEHAEIRLEVEKISCKMADLHEPYPTQFLPRYSNINLT
jgi:hypothetical protein